MIRISPKNICFRVNYTVCTLMCFRIYIITSDIQRYKDHNFNLLLEAKAIYIIINWSMPQVFSGRDLILCNTYRKVFKQTSNLDNFSMLISMRRYSVSEYGRVWTRH